MLKQIRYFQSVVHNQSFSKAAEENYISQSAISQQIQALEQTLGCRLLERQGRKFALTPAGKYFYQKSLVLVSDYDQICAETLRIANGDRAALKIGCLRDYTGTEFRQALEQFSGSFPEASVCVAYGNHEELYALLRTGRADLVVNDQRRAFSDEYVNLILAAYPSMIEVSAHSPLAQLEKITPQELKNLPCILIASPTQRETEQTFFHQIIGFSGTFLYAENLEEARTMVISRQGFLPVEDSRAESLAGRAITRIPLVRGEEPILRNYCAFWRKKNENPLISDFVRLLQQQFSK